MNQPTDGYYWVKVQDDWEPARYSRGVWWFCGWEHGLEANELQEVGERIERPGDPK